MYRHVGRSKGRRIKENGVAVRKGKGKYHETYSICPRHGIDRESFRHDERDEGPLSSIGEENRPERGDIITPQ